MGDVDALPALIRYLESSETLAETASAAQAVGLVGDRSAVKPLLDILGNKSKQPLQRGFAEIALGILAEKSSLPWNVVFAVDAKTGQPPTSKISTAADSAAELASRTGSEAVREGSLRANPTEHGRLRSLCGHGTVRNKWFVGREPSTGRRPTASRPNDVHIVLRHGDDGARDRDRVEADAGGRRS